MCIWVQVRLWMRVHVSVSCVCVGSGSYKRACVVVYLFVLIRI